jgi:4-diphosphocytidyl-2-C-methyl-D-erythritol kinase
MKSVLVPAFAKINLGLEVLGVRKDGYHEIRTLFQTLDLHDDIVIRETKGPIEVSCDHRNVPDGPRNLAYRAAVALRRFAGTQKGAKIDIVKRIPVGGGMGGGSSNAAAVLMALDRMWGAGLGRAGLVPLARRLGADVPYFLQGGTALGTGRGDEIYPLRVQVRAHVVVVDPGGPVSTAAVYERLDARLTPRKKSYNITRFVSSDLERAGAFSSLTNDLEASAWQVAPDLAAQAVRVLRSLKARGAVLASMTGSGSVLFGLFLDGRAARRAEASLAREGLAATRARTLTLGQYRAAWSRLWRRLGPATGRDR